MDQEQPEYDWYKVFAAGDGRGDFVKEGKIRIAIVRDERLLFSRKGGQVHAFRSKCPHNGAPLEKGFFNESGDLVCPFHRFAFCIETGENTSGEGYYLARYPVEFRENGMYVGYERPPRSKSKGWWPFW